MDDVIDTLNTLSTLETALKFEAARLNMVKDSVKSQGEMVLKLISESQIPPSTARITDLGVNVDAVG